MGIKDYYIDKRIKEAIGKVMKLKEEASFLTITNVAIIVDENSSFNKEEFKNLKNLLGLESSNFHVLTYRDKKSVYDEFRGAILTKKSVDWKGKVISEYVKNFLEREYDLLIDYTTESPRIKQMIVAETKAVFKVGFAVDDNSLYDLMIDVKPTEVAQFNEELIRYLSILKLI